MRVILLALCAAHAQAWSIKDRGAGIDSVETTFQTRLKGGGKGVTLTYVLAACGDEVGELEEDVREDEGAKYLDATELHAAAFGGRADCCEKLVARGDAVDVKLNTTNWTPMHVAAQGGNAAVVEYLLGQGADPNAAGVDPTPDRPPNQVGPAPDGFTALHAAVRAGSLATVRLLLDAGAELEAESDEKSPLFVAVRQKRCDIAAVLLEKGADASHCVASAGLCPIHAATSPDRLTCLTALLAHGADPNAFDAYGTTPLRVAAIKGDEMGIINKEIIEALIKAGANAKMDEQYTQWLKDHPEAQSPAPPELAGEEL